MPSGWNDNVSSLAVYRTELGKYSRGTWKGITATEGIDYTVHYGFTTTKSTETIDTEMYSLSYQMTTGMKFELASESETVTEAYTSTITTDTKATMTKDFSIDISIPCTG